MRRRSVLLVLLIASVFLALLTWRVLYLPRPTLLPFTYSAAQGSIRVRAGIAGHPHPLEFNSLLAKTVLGHRVFQQVSQTEVGLDRVNPSAEFGLGNYHTHLFYGDVPDTELHASIDGVLGIDMFAPSPGFDGKNARLGARLTFDFKANLFKIEDGSKLKTLKLPKGTLQAPLLRDGDGPYYLLLPLNNGDKYPFVLGIGCRDVLLPTASVLFPDPQGIAYTNAIGPVPVTLTFGGQDLSSLAIAPPADQSVGVLGMSLLANYRVVIDFRNKFLYLEPTASRADL